MKLDSRTKILLLLISSFIFISPVYSDELGRLFTSQQDRRKLDRIRNTKPKPEPEKVEVIEVDIEGMIEPVVEKKEIVIRDAITLKGIVHRSDGKNTAWINDSNTFEGNLESQFIQVPDSKISSDQATIIMPDDSTEVELKVGEVFTPNPIVQDVVNTENNR